MAREARKVTADWQHPRGAEGKFIPMFEPQMGELMKGVHFSRFPCHMLFFSFLDEITSDASKSSGKSCR